MFRLAVVVIAVLGLSAGTARAWCDEPWVPVATSTTIPAGCPYDLWMDDGAAPVYRWDGDVRGDALTGEVIAEDVASFGVRYDCIVGACSHHRRDYTISADRVRFTLADAPGTIVTLGDAAGPLVELAITDGGRCPVPSVGPAKQCGSPELCTIGCNDDDDDGGCSASGARPRGGFPVAVIAAMAGLIAFVSRRRRRR